MCESISVLHLKVWSAQSGWTVNVLSRWVSELVALSVERLGLRCQDGRNRHGESVS